MSSRLTQIAYSKTQPTSLVSLLGQDDFIHPVLSPLPGGQMLHVVHVNVHLLVRNKFKGVVLHSNQQFTWQILQRKMYAYLRRLFLLLRKFYSKGTEH